jgi:hypothetical protein
MTEMTFGLSGIKPEISAVVWLCRRVMHQVSEGGYTVALELENQLAEDEDLAALVEAEYTGVIAWYRDKDGNQQPVTEGDQTSPLRLTHLYASQASAERAVKREWERLEK